MKPGIRTTELLTTIAAGLGISTSNVPHAYVPYVAAIAIAYVLGRSIVKALQTPQPLHDLMAELDTAIASDAPGAAAPPESSVHPDPVPAPAAPLPPTAV